MSPERLWLLSTRLHSRGLTPLARLVKILNYFLWRVVLPYECEVGEGVRLWHRGLGTVVHPNTTIGCRVQIAHGVTIAAGSEDPASPFRVVIGDGVTIGAGAIVIAGRGRVLTLGAGCVVAAGAVVTRDVAAGETVASPAARTVARHQVPGT
jgi:serine O-acetyltransferase